jgi:hypothetical protein
MGRDTTVIESGHMKTAAVAAAYLGLAVAATWPLTGRAHDSVFGVGTPPLNVWAIGWVLHQLPRDPVHLFDANAFHPYARSLAFSEHLFVPSLLAAPWALLTGNLVLAHNLTALVTLALAGMGMYLFCRELIGDGWAAIGGGIVYAFHTWNVNELIRLQILSNAWFPWLLLSLVRYFRAPGWRRGLLCGALCAAQTLSCMYWALYMPLVLAPVLFVLARKRARPRDLVPLAAGLGLAFAVTALFFIPYLQNARAFGFHRGEPAPVPLDRYLDVLPGNVLYAGLLGTARPNENAAHFLGFSALALAAAGLLAPRTGEDGLAGWRGLLALYAGGGLLLSLGPRIQAGGHDLGPGPYALLHHFAPGFGSVRYPERFALVLVLGLAPLVAGGLARLGRRWGAATAAAACAVLFLEHFSAPLRLEPLAPSSRAPSVYGWLATRDDVHVVAEVPASANWMERSDALPMYFSTVHWKKTPQGFTGYFPPASNFIRWRLHHFPDAESIAFLRSFGVDTVVVRAEGGRLPGWVLPRDGWSVVGPFAEGDAVLRLHGVQGSVPVPAADPAPPPGLLEVGPDAWRAFASHPNVGRAHDRRPDTAWTTGEAAREDDHYGVRFAEPTTVARIVIDVGHPFEFPTRLEIRGRRPGGELIDVPYDVAGAYDRLFALLLHRPREARLELDVATPPLKELHLRISGNDEFVLPWTMAEVRLYTHR